MVLMALFSFVVTVMIFSMDIVDIDGVACAAATCDCYWMLLILFMCVSVTSLSRSVTRDIEASIVIYV
jgi:hypothetical protein